MDRKLGWIHGRALLVGLFVSMGCGPSEAEQEADFFEEQTDLWCQLSTACDPTIDADSCPVFRGGDCRGFNPDKVDACLDAIEEALEEALQDPEMCAGPQMPDVCFEATPSTPNAPGCEGVPGRPIRDQTGLALADVHGGGPVADGERGRAGAQWLEAARMEHASVAAFGRLATELLAVGAPLTLVTKAHEAALDEARHTEICLSHAHAMGHRGWTLGRLRVVPARPAITLETLALEALLEGCVGEGIAAAQAAVAGGRARPGVAEDLRGIARDELRHAELAWQVVGWALSRDPSLAVPLRAALAQWQADAQAQVPPDHEGAPEFGVLSGHECHLIARAFVRDVTAPALGVVLQTHQRRAS